MSKLPFYVSTTYNMTHFELTAYEYTWYVSDCLMDALYSVVIWIFFMDVFIYDAHIIQYMNPLQSVALGQSYFGHLDYLVAHYWIQATLHPTISTPAGAPSVWKYVQLFEGMAVYMPKSAPCYHIVIIFHNFFPHITTAYPLSLNIILDSYYWVQTASTFLH